MERFFITSWILGIVFGLCIIIISYIERDKEKFEVGVAFLFLFVLTGYITFLPVAIVFLMLLILNRFEN